LEDLRGRQEFPVLLCSSDLIQFQDFASILLAPANVPAAKGNRLG